MSAAPPVTLAVDLGTSGVKVALVEDGGRVLGWESEPIRLLVTPDGGAEQVPDEWWSGFLAAAPATLSAVPSTIAKTRSKRASASSITSSVSAMLVYMRLPASVTMPSAR